MMNVDHEDWRLPSEVDLTKDLSTCARPGLQDSLSQYSQHIHPTNHSPTTHWLTFKAEIAVSEWVSVPCASVECQHVDQVTIPGYISLELKIRCRGWILFSPKNYLVVASQYLMTTWMVTFLCSEDKRQQQPYHWEQTGGIQTGYNKDQVSCFRWSMFCTSSLTTEKTLHCFDVFRLWKVIWYFREKKYYFTLYERKRSPVVKIKRFISMKESQRFNIHKLILILLWTIFWGNM